jgi:hypothetical protein
MRERLTRIPSHVGLKKLNLTLGVLYGLELLAVLVVSKSHTAPLTTSYVAVDSLQSASSGNLVLAPASRFILDLNLLWLVAIALAAGAIVHLLVATYARSRYETGLKQQQNVWRWGTFGITASLLFVCFAVLTGVYDLTMLVVVTVLVFVLHAIAWRLEKAASSRNKSRPDVWLGYGATWALGLAAWFVAGQYLYAANVYGEGHIAGSIYALSGVMAAISLMFATRLFLFIRRPKTSQQFRLYDRNQTMLLFVTTSILVWQIVVGALL